MTPNRVASGEIFQTAKLLFPSVISISQRFEGRAKHTYLGGWKGGGWMVGSSVNKTNLFNQSSNLAIFAIGNICGKLYKVLECK